MAKKVVVLGGGLVGTPMALDLNKNIDWNVVLADRSVEQLSRAKAEGIDCIACDLMEEGAIENLVQSADFVINALPGEIGYQSLKRVIQAGKSGVDIAFYPEDFEELDQLAKEKGVTWLVDMGVAPGMSHLLSAYGATLLDDAQDIKIYVGGLPKDKSTFWQYKAPFSPSDVIEEYTRPARFVRDGNEVVMPALTETEVLEFPVVGQLEAFNSDGLRSLIKSLDVPNMIEKTLRYPGYINKVMVLKESGFLSDEMVMVNGKEIKAIDFTSSVLFEQWKLKPQEREFTVMQIIISGLEGGKQKKIFYDLYDAYDPETNIHSMARTTGYTATVVLGLLKEGLFGNPGVHPPETLANYPDLVHEILKGLKERGVVYKKSETYQK
ncbi:MULTISPECIES: saccharopine dehydrogenase family protein [unclassified Lentimicrobium]|uniref:saccharopine dehydrogenase family protein n=1 Tax=unclassified Lentimicrobium TaxID=2677434 RepID=UPI001556519A|nr:MULTISPECIES: saccharopine dehydrogenase C-terminal domain-containing protein [unclassified Lentimicrobium]NPD45538.1 saccharopine dehydrogenase [Lentimicrobium sp. S6]NPD84048.1 saccharopine dehydrogenase [Lentimicrobium sp. L6]